MNGPPLRGRGTASNPPNRFEPLHYVPDPDDPDAPAPRTQFLRDSSKTVISYNDSPDVPFDASLNPYRGCEHGCVYCYARPTHEYLGFSAGLDFETRILVKEHAPELLESELKSPRWKPQTLALSGVTDPYQPIERRLELTRRCLTVLREFANPVSIVTKNALVTRDRDLLADLAGLDAVCVFVSITTLDAGLARILEPRTSHPQRRLDAIRTLTEAGVPTGVLVAPVIPGLNDHEVPRVVEAAAASGARFAGYVLLRLPHGVADLFERWLDDHFADRKAKILERVRSTRDGRLNDSSFGSRMRGRGIFAEQIDALFRISCAKHSIARHGPQLSTAAFRRSPFTQLTLFDEVDES